MRVLVAEDEQLLADAVADGLRHLGMAVDVCYDGDDALELEFGLRVPVVEVDGEERFEYRVDPAALAALVR